MRVGYILGNL